MYVALDIETTGLDIESDHVTEIGMVRFDDAGTELESFATCVNPGRSIPLFVQQLTGVTDNDVASAPALRQLAERVVAFAGDDPVIGHNIEFDRSYLRRGGIHFRGPSIDTAEFARLIFPSRRGRGLADIACELGMEHTGHHRALADARMARDVFLGLRSRFDDLEAAQRSQLGRLLAFHNEALASILAPGEQEPGPASPGLQPPRQWPRLEPSDDVITVDAAQVERVFAAAPSAMDTFEERPQQRQMAEYVRGALAGGGQYLVEAGTGVGKSLAYLVPAALHALHNQRRIVVSTNTIGLQEQLLTKDIPALREMLCNAGILEDGEDLRVSLLKGRANYLCLQRWTASYGASMADPDFGRLASSMLLWLPETETGDRSELGLDHNDYLTWQRFSAQDADCLSRQNSWVREGYCFLARARRAAESAHIIIVNHALLLADIAAGGSAIPAYDALVVDEAHNLEETATRQFGASVSRRQLLDALDAIHRPRGPQLRAGGVAELLRNLENQSLKSAGDDIARQVEHARERLEPFVAALATLLSGGEDDRALLSGAVRSGPGWDAIEDAAQSLDMVLRDISGRAENAAQSLNATGEDERSALGAEIETAARRLDELRMRVAALLGPPREDMVTWVSRERDGAASLNMAPLDVGPALREQLFDESRTVVATSATLAVGDNVRYASDRLGLQEADFLQLGSPFDYRASTLLAAVTDVPEPSDRTYAQGIALALEELVRASGGRAVALFTSHAALRKVAELVRPGLEAEGIAVLAQGVDGPPGRLVADLLAQPRSVILGTASFWEGVDVPGDALSLLVIARLPFAVPTDPVYQARSGLYNNPFMDYALPAAVLRFRQGFGRLIRHRDDRGVVAILDRRVLTKRYGSTFVESLPECSMLKADTETVATRTAEWLGS